MMIPIMSYLPSDELPDDKYKARHLRAKVVRFSILDGHLLRRFFFEPYVKCVTLTEVSYILIEHHQGECGNHARG